MSYWYLLPISATLMVLGVLLYLLLRWRKARRAFRAMVVVAIANVAAGVLLGLWSMHMVDSWTGSPAGSAPSAPPSASAGATAETNPLGPIVASYVGQALAQERLAKITDEEIETWPQIDQGCRLGNYERSSALCRASVLVVHGWNDMTPIPLSAVQDFCDAGYLNKDLALCLVAASSSEGTVHSPTAGSTPSAESSGITRSELYETMRAPLLDGLWGPDGQYKKMSDITANCERRIYAPDSPACEAAVFEKHPKAGTETVPFRRVAHFCDLGLVQSNMELCRAAYRVVRSESGTAP
jgi:hypothetical protein